MIDGLNRNGGGKPSAITDLWISGNHDAVRGLTLNWLSSQFKMNEVVIGFRKITKDRSGGNIAAASYQITITCDNALAIFHFVDELVIITSWKESGVGSLLFKRDDWIRWFAHVINLAVGDSLKACNEILKEVSRFACCHGL